MKLDNDCVDCLNASEVLQLVDGHTTKVMVCEYQHGTFPHALNCSTCQPEVCHCSLDIGGAPVKENE